VVAGVFCEGSAEGAVLSHEDGRGQQYSVSNPSASRQHRDLSIWRRLGVLTLIEPMSLKDNFTTPVRTADQQYSCVCFPGDSLPKSYCGYSLAKQ